MANKAVMIMFEVKFDGKLNFLLWKMRITALLVKDGVYKTLDGKEKKSLKMDDDEWNDIDFRTKATIIPCLLNVLYNMMNEETNVGLWCKFESLYMSKSLSNKLFMKQLYGLRMKEDIPILQHLNTFNRIVSDLLAFEVKQEEEEDKALLLLCSLLLSYDHLVMIMYGKEILKLEYVHQVH